MARLDYFVVADSVAVDRDTNRVSVFNIFEEMSGKLPAMIPHLVAVTCWLIEPEDLGKDFQVILRIPLPWEEPASKHIDIPANFTAERTRHRVCHYLDALVVKQPGDLAIQILLNGEPVAAHVVTVRALDQDPRATVEPS